MSVRVERVLLSDLGDAEDGRTGLAYAVLVTWSAPKRLNALTGAMMAQAADAVREADADPAVMAVVFTGDPASRLMSSGADLSAGTAASESLRDSTALDFMRAVRACRPLVCVAIHGAAVGIMLTVLAHSDLAVADRSAFFMAPFGPLGICPEFGASRLLPQRMGRQAAMKVMLWGDRISAEDALRAGIVTELVDAGRFEAGEAAGLSSAIPPGLATPPLRRVMDRLVSLARSLPRPSRTARLFREMVTQAAAGASSVPDLLELEMRTLGQRLRDGIPMEAMMLRARSGRDAKL